MASRSEPETVELQHGGGVGPSTVYRVLLIHRDQNGFSELFAEYRRRFEQWNVDHQLNLSRLPA